MADDKKDKDPAPSSGELIRRGPETGSFQYAVKFVGGNSTGTVVAPGACGTKTQNRRCGALDRQCLCEAVSSGRCSQRPMPTLMR
jgi:hypothetical protein